MCRPGGLHDSEWQNIRKELGLKQGEWQFITKKLKAAGMIRKDGHIYRPTKTLLGHLQDLASALSRYYINLGVRMNESR